MQKEKTSLNSKARCCDWICYMFWINFFTIFDCVDCVHFSRVSERFFSLFLFFGCWSHGYLSFYPFAFENGYLSNRLTAIMVTSINFRYASIKRLFKNLCIKLTGRNDTHIHTDSFQFMNFFGCLFLVIFVLITFDDFFCKVNILVDLVNFLFFSFDIY